MWSLLRTNGKSLRQFTNQRRKPHAAFAQINGNISKGQKCALLNKQAIAHLHSLTQIHAHTHAHDVRTNAKFYNRITTEYISSAQCRTENLRHKFYGNRIVCFDAICSALCLPNICIHVYHSEPSSYLAIPYSAT